jgi:hypothetical protein
MRQRAPWLLPASGPRVELPALGLTAPDDALAGKRSLRLRDDRVLAFPVIVVVEVGHHPVVRPPELVGAGGIGVERGEVPRGRAGCGARGSQAFPSGLKRRGAIARSVPDAAFSRYSRSMSSNLAALGPSGARRITRGDPRRSCSAPAAGPQLSCRRPKWGGAAPAVSERGVDASHLHECRHGALEVLR